jgi:hypothetical protein
MYKTNYLIECIEKNIPISFSKYGDGEYLCASKNFKIKNNNNCNCDNDNYTQKLSDSVRNSFIYMVKNANNAFFGMWHEEHIIKYWQNLVNKDINWISYSSLLPYDNNIEKLKIFKAIKNSNIKKIYVCNELLIKAKDLLNIDHMVIIPMNNWFDTQFNNVLEQIKSLIGPNDNNHIVMTSCGMSAKVLICELYKIYPNGIYLDIGSGIDTICTKRSTRGLEVDYNFALNYFNELLPDNWNDPKYNYIYEEAQNKLGLHLPKNNM